MFVPEAQASAGGGMGVITVNLVDDGPRDAAVVAFEAQRDAEAAAWGWAAAHEAIEGRPQCAPLVSSSAYCVKPSEETSKAKACVEPVICLSAVVHLLHVLVVLRLECGQLGRNRAVHYCFMRGQSLCIELHGVSCQLTWSCLCQVSCC